jgi:hypothetical protein
MSSPLHVQLAARRAVAPAASFDTRPSRELDRCTGSAGSAVARPDDDEVRR